MTFYRYSRWDGTQEIFPLHEDELMEELSESLLNQGDVSTALRSMTQRGVKGKYGDRLGGIQDLLQKLRQLRQSRLDQYNLGSLMEDLQKRLESVLQKEKGGIQRRLDEAQQRLKDAQSSQDKDRLSAETAEQLFKRLENLAQKSKEFLDQLPKDLAGAVRQLQQYDFMDDEAKREFDELMQMLQRQVMESFSKQLSQQIQDLTPEDIQRIKDMIKQLNSMLEEQAKGGQPDFQRFMKQFGDLFGDNPPQSLKELVQQLQQQMAQMQSLLNSLTPEMRRSLQDLMQSVLKDEELREELAQLAANLEMQYPTDDLARDYPFKGEDPVSLAEAMKLMEELQGLEQLERQLTKAQQGDNLSDVDSEQIAELLGEEARQTLERLKRLADMLEQAGYIRRIGNRFELTPKGMRKIGQKALHEIFAYMKKDRLGKHPTQKMGIGGDKVDDNKPYEFGDPLIIDLPKTIMNALKRESGVPIALKPDDFEVFRTEQLVHSATVLMLDLSLSMAMRGNFLAAKKVTLALDNLIRTQFPRDALYIVGFSTYAREVKVEKLPYLSWDEFDPYTNIQHGLVVSQKLLSRVKGGTKQIIMISDGEPTAHIEGGQLFLQYPPSPRTIRETLREVRRCTQKGIIINTFMLDRNSYLMEFVDQLTRINKGRVFYTSPERLGQYVLVDYLSSRRRLLF